MKTQSRPTSASHRDYLEITSEVITGHRQFAFLCGNCLDILKEFPNNIIECVITSPPYWQLREYDISENLNGHLIGNESQPEEYVEKLVTIFNEVKRLLKSDGSLWLNLGDKYHNKNLMGMPWRVALAMQNEGWILRNDIIWDQMKGTQSVKDRMRDVYEHIFHFVKSRKYYFDAEAVRIKPKKSAVLVEDKPISATGVSGKKYKELIQNSPYLDEDEKKNALKALSYVLNTMKDGEIVDFRMTIRGHQRTYHSESTKISGRAKELENKGYFFILMRSNGNLPPDIWRIVPEDKWREDAHCAVFPEELLSIPIKSTSRLGGIVLDPFSGTGSTVAAALNLGRKGIGIDLSESYIKISETRIGRSLNGYSKLLF
jgi:DNA modification methylase